MNEKRNTKFFILFATLVMLIGIAMATITVSAANQVTIDKVIYTESVPGLYQDLNPASPMRAFPILLTKNLWLKFQTKRSRAVPPL